MSPIYKKSGEDDLGDCKAVSLSLVSQENHGASLLGCLFFGHVMEKVIGISQHRLTKGKSCVTNLSAL